MLMKTPSERSYSVTGTISTSCRWWLSVAASSSGYTAARLAQAALIRKVALIGSPATFSVGIDIVVSLLDRFCADCQRRGASRKMVQQRDLPHLFERRRSRMGCPSIAGGQGQTRDVGIGTSS